MWPIGYLVVSPYSPFHLERQMPDRNWRDPFEDLIALESGGQMVSTESRKKEAEVAARLHYEHIYRKVSMINEQLHWDAKYMSLVQRERAFAARHNESEIISWIDNEAVPEQKAKTEETILAGEHMIKTLTKEETKGWPASKHKSRGEWMASLIWSGALPGWRAHLYDGSRGEQLEIDKTKSHDKEEVDPDDYWVSSELGIKNFFEDGVPLEHTGAETWSTYNGQYPEYEWIQKFDPYDRSINWVEARVPSVRPSIAKQIIEAERTKFANGSISTKVKISNIWTDQRIENKEIVDDPSKVLEEVREAKCSILNRNHSIFVAKQEEYSQEFEQQLKECEEWEETLR